MTWIRWDTATPRSKVVAFLAERLGIRPAYALGHYNAMCCEFGEHQQDGRIDQVADSMLELWAEWPGRKGKFAAAMREWCTKSETPGHDPGELRGWWRQKALLMKQDQDRKKPDGRKKSRANPPGDSSQSRTGFEGATDERTNGRTDERLSATDGVNPVTLVAVAANRGLQSNPGLSGFNELLPQQADQAVKDWLAAGIALALICSVVEHKCAIYKPGLNGSQPSSFAYFDKAIRQAHQQGIGKLQLASAPESPAAKKPSRLKDLTEDLSV